MVELSVSGVSFQASGFKVRDNVSLRLAHLNNMNDNVECAMTVLKAGETIAYGQFYPTMSLMRYIVRLVSDVTNVLPRYVKQTISRCDSLYSTFPI